MNNICELAILPENPFCNLPSPFDHTVYLEMLFLEIRDLLRCAYNLYLPSVKNNKKKRNKAEFKMRNVKFLTKFWRDVRSEGNSG